MQILQTDLHTFPSKISWENFITDQRFFPFVIILLILIDFALDNLWILLGENWCWSLLGLKGLSQDNLTDTVGDRFQIRVAGRPIKRNRYEWTGPKSFFSGTT